MRVEGLLGRVERRLQWRGEWQKSALKEREWQQESSERPMFEQTSERVGKFLD
jgi:hypothetical protein